jgi:hypothetical protein
MKNGRTVVFLHFQNSDTFDFMQLSTYNITENIFFFCSTLSEFENFLLCERILINVKTKRQANFKGF